MKTAIFGFAGSGKTELFKALAGPEVQGNRAMVKVPEPRLDPLAQIFSPPKVTYTEIEYLDIPGGGDKKGGLGQRVINEIRAYDCLLAVIDGFSGLQGPMDQYKDIEADLIIADLTVVEKRLEKMSQDKKKSKQLVNPKEEALLQEVLQVLESEAPLRTRPDLSRAVELKSYSFLSGKPILYALNVGEEDLERGPLLTDQAQEGHIVISAKLERELVEVDELAERAELFADLGLSESALHKVIAKTYQLLGLITFLTAGEKEVRAWTVPQGATAPEAAGTIHSDLQKGFIRAEVLSWEDFLRCRDFKQAKEKGLLRLEGKDYLVQDGDIITFRFNV